jgi:crotonobetainyl-CoA:carnitine CoA-transferase CaiB-like acyl-CoA transferase
VTQYSALSTQHSPAPLDGIRVIDLGVVLAGPQAALLLADLGAEVIRVESIQYFPPQTRGIFARPSKEVVAASIPISGGYPNREPGERPWNRFPWFNATARNKLGMTVTLTQPEGHEVFMRLVAISDVLVSNQSPGTLESLGLGYEALAAVNPGLVYVEASSFGATGPYRNYRALGLQMEAYAGHDLLRQYPDRDVSSNTWAVTADAAGALGIALAAQMGLYARLRTGRGQHVDLSMVENFVGLMGHAILDFTFNGRVPQSLGNRDYAAIQGCYPCRGNREQGTGDRTVGAEAGSPLPQSGGGAGGGGDRWLVLTLPDDASWRAFCRTAGNPQGCDDPRFATVASRYAHHDAVDGLIAGWTRGISRDEAVERLRDEGVMAGPVLDDADVMQDRHLAARGYFVKVQQEDTGLHTYPGMPYRFHQAELGVRLPPVRLGEHNDYVYKTLLGVSDEQYADLTARGHIGMDYAPQIR